MKNDIVIALNAILIVVLALCVLGVFNYIQKTEKKVVALEAAIAQMVNVADDVHTRILQDIQRQQRWQDVATQTLEVRNIRLQALEGKQ